MTPFALGPLPRALAHAASFWLGGGVEVYRVDGGWAVRACAARVGPMSPEPLLEALDRARDHGADPAAVDAVASASQVVPVGSAP